MSSESSSDEPSYNYVDLMTSDAGASDYMKYVGRLFDDSEDGGTFKVLNVCDMQKVGARRSTNIVYAFKYINVDDDGDDDVLHTPVREMLNSYWCKWKTNSSQRGSRSSRRSLEDTDATASSSSSSATAAPTSSRTSRSSAKS